MAKAVVKKFENIEAKIEGSKMTLTIDLKKDCGPSSSGKTLLIGTTRGNKEFEGIMLALNIYKYAKPRS